MKVCIILVLAETRMERIRTCWVFFLKHLVFALLTFLLFPVWNTDVMTKYSGIHVTLAYVLKKKKSGYLKGSLLLNFVINFLLLYTVLLFTSSFGIVQGLFIEFYHLEAWGYEKQWLHSDSLAHLIESHRALRSLPFLTWSPPDSHAG